MPDSTPNTPSPLAASFASLLAGLTAHADDKQEAQAPPQPAEAAQRRKPAPAWGDQELAEDVATLSYEQALRARARYKASAPQLPVQSARAKRLRADAGNSVRAARRRAGAGLAPGLDPLGKISSVTIRMSSAENEQLRRRAAEAGLTVSAYLRSCIFEAENLRSEVKEAVAKLRTPSSTTVSAVPDSLALTGSPLPEKKPPVSAVPGWRARLLPHWGAKSKVAQA